MKLRSTINFTPLSIGLLAIASHLPLLGESRGEIHRIDPAFDELLGKDAQVEILGEGFSWSEGPVWVPQGNFLLFSDVPENIMYKWSEKDGISVFLEPSGYTGLPRKGYKQGSNGLALTNNGQLLICEGGDRRLSKLDFFEGKRRVVADNYNGARFNSPNDLVVASNGDIYMTDPVWGLEKHAEDPSRDMDYEGIFLIRTNGEVILLDDQHKFPNGIALSPSEEFLYECQFEKWFRYPVLEDGTLGEGTLFFDATFMIEEGLKGSTDGMAVDIHGNLWATGPGGVLILSPEGKLLGRIDTGTSIANCCFGGDGSTLYITSNGFLCRIETLTTGVGFQQ